MAITLQTTVTAPVRRAERMDTLDAVRGVAVLGILLANLFPMSGLAFAAPSAYVGLPLANWHEPLTFLMFFLVEGKFYSLFSFLFGVGFAVFVSRAAARGADARRLFKRRLVGLLLIGLAHTLFIWMGDILVTYAVIGFALLPFLSKSDRAVLRVAAIMLALPIGLYGAALAAVTVASGGLPQSPPLSEGALPPFLQSAVDSFAGGSYVDVVTGNVAFTVANVIRRLMLMFFPRVFGMFLLGFYAGRLNLFGELDRHVPLLRRVLLWGTVVGMPFSWAGAMLDGHAMGVPTLAGLLETTLKSIGVPALSLAYGAGLCLLLRRAAALRRALAPAGQMALTNYLTHSVAAVAIFYGIGLGYWARVPLAIVMAGAVALFALQVFASRWWLSHAAFGPAEWIWRMFTYRRRVPLFTQ